MTMNHWLVLTLFVAGVAAMFLYQGAGKTSPEQVRRLIGEGAALIDVRTVGEFASGHLEGARNLPLSQLPARMVELGDKNAPLVVYCRSGARSGQAKRLLERAGFSAVYDLGAMHRFR